MKTYISILRGINVGGQKKIKMIDLKKLYEKLGFVKVQTYIQSGNVIFQTNKTNPTKLEQLIFDEIKSHYGFEVPNLILSPEEIEVALDNNPFEDFDNMYFTFLSQKPEEENINHLKEFNFEGEYYQLHEKLIYFHCPSGYGRAKMNNTFFEKKLKVTATSRNLKTTEKLLEMAKFTR